jgi:hypothetical protein
MASNPFELGLFGERNGRHRVFALESLLLRKKSPSLSITDVKRLNFVDPRISPREVETESRTQGKIPSVFE